MAAIAATASGLASEMSRSIRIAATHEGDEVEELEVLEEPALAKAHARSAQDQHATGTDERTGRARRPRPPAGHGCPCPARGTGRSTESRPAPTVWTTGPRSESSISGLCPDRRLAGCGDARVSRPNRTLIRAPMRRSSLRGPVGAAAAAPRRGFAGERDPLERVRALQDDSPGRRPRPVGGQQRVEVGAAPSRMVESRANTPRPTRTRYGGRPSSRDRAFAALRGPTRAPTRSSEASSSAARREDLAGAARASCRPARRRGRSRAPRPSTRTSNGTLPSPPRRIVTCAVFSPARAASVAVPPPDGRRTSTGATSSPVGPVNRSAKIPAVAIGLDRERRRRARIAGEVEAAVERLERRRASRASPGTTTGSGPRRCRRPERAASKSRLKPAKA